MTHPHVFTAIDADELPDYPLSVDDRLDSHWFMTWERRRWLNSDMRLRGTPECRALYFDLINIAFDHSPIGTLPRDMDVLARLAGAEAMHFKALCRLEYGPLHKWRPCRCGDEVRLYHPIVLKTVLDAIAGKESSIAKNDAANTSKRLQRLRRNVTGLHAELAKNDAAILWMDGWLVQEGCGYRSALWIERAMTAWSRHVMQLQGRARAG